MLADAVAGELIASEIEIRSGPRRGLRATRVARQREAPPRGCSRSPTRRASRSARPGTHPLGRTTASSTSSTPSTTAASRTACSTWRWRNNTFSLHVHVGVRGADRAVARLRPAARRAADAAGALGELAVPRRPRLRPALRAHADLHQDRSRAAAIPDAVRRLGRPTRTTSTCSYATELDRRVHAALVERAAAPLASAPSRCGSATRRRAATSRTALAGLIVGLRRAGRARLRRGRAAEPTCPAALIEENFWRAIRYGLDGKLIDLDRAEEYPAAAALDGSWPGRRRRGCARHRPGLPEQNGAQRQQRALAEGASTEDIYAAEVALTQRTYAAEEVAT